MLCNVCSKHAGRRQRCVRLTETFWRWHSLYGSAVSGSWRTSPAMWNTAAGVSMMGVSVCVCGGDGDGGGGGGRGGVRGTASWVFCRGEPEPMPGADRTNQGRARASSMHANRGRGRGRLQGSLPRTPQRSRINHLSR